MDSRKKKWMERLRLLILACSLMYLMYEGSKVDDRLPRPAPGVPQVYSEPAAIDGDTIRQILGNEQLVYVLYDTLESDPTILEIYDPKGNHQVSYLFYNHQNSGFQMDLQGNKLYIWDTRYLYIIDCDEYVSSQTRDEAEDILQTIRYDTESERYRLRGVSVWDDLEQRYVLERSYVGHL